MLPMNGMLRMGFTDSDKKIVDGHGPEINPLKAFLKNWHHIPISRSGKVKTTLYNECCNDDCDIQ